MKKTVFLIILGVVTIGCIIFGSVRHIGGGVKSLQNSFFWDSRDDEEVKAGSINQRLDAFSEIRIDSSVLEIRIEEGDGFKIEGHYNTEKLKPNFTVTNGKLVVTQGHKRNNFGIQNSRVTIIVPKNTQLKEVDINSNVGDIQLRDVEANKIDIDVNVGEVSLREVSFTKIDVDTNVGEVSINLKDDYENYDISASTDVGAVNIGKTNFKRSYNSKGNGDRVIKVNTNVGEINIK